MRLFLFVLLALSWQSYASTEESPATKWNKICERIKRWSDEGPTTNGWIQTINDILVLPQSPSITLPEDVLAKLTQHQLPLPLGLTTENSKYRAMIEEMRNCALGALEPHRRKTPLTRVASQTLYAQSVVAMRFYENIDKRDEWRMLDSARLEALKSLAILNAPEKTS